jgi:hypothetical protein
MNIKKKPVIIKFDRKEDRQKFLNWALGKSEPTKGIKKAKAAMLLAKHNGQSPSELDAEKTLGDIGSPIAHTGRGIKGGRKIRRRNWNYANRTRDGKNGAIANHRRG